MRLTLKPPGDLVDLKKPTGVIYDTDGTSGAVNSEISQKTKVCHV